jgi:small-conductance mechanosensitive channel
MIDPWIWASGAIIVGLLSGVVGAALVHRIILKGREDRPEINDAARATATFLFLFFVAVGVIVAIGFINPETLEPIPADVLRTSPRILAAGLILIAGRAMAFAVGGLVNGALEGSSGRVRAQITATVRLLIYAASIVLALSQLGVDTTILSIITAAVTFGLAGAFALLVGLGGRTISGDLAAGRYLHRLVRVGDRIEYSTGSGRIVALHPASVELDPGDGSSVHIPHSVLMRSELKVVHE